MRLCPPSRDAESRTRHASFRTGILARAQSIGVLRVAALDAFEQRLGLSVLDRDAPAATDRSAGQEHAAAIAQRRCANETPAGGCQSRWNGRIPILRRHGNETGHQR